MSRGIVAIRKQLSRYALREREWNATLGNGAGVVRVPGKNHMNYVMVDGFDLPMVVANYSTSYINGLRVTVGKVSGELVVKKYKPLGGWDPKHNPTVGQHAPNHGWGGPDAVYISSRQMLELAAYTGGGLSIKLMPGVVQDGVHTWRVDYQTIDLTSHLPANDVRFVLVAVDMDDGTISLTDGDIFTLDGYDVSYIPATPPGHQAKWAVRLYAGQTVISDNYTDPDLIDLRFAGGGGGSGGSIGLQHTMYHSDGSVTAYPATAAGVTAAYAAYVSGDRLGLFPGHYTGDFTIACDTDGFGYEGTTLEGALTLSPGVHVNNCKLLLTTTGSTDAIGTEGPATDGATLQDCTVITSQTGTGDATCIHLNGGWVSARNTYFRSTAADVGATARIITSAGAVDDCIFVGGVTFANKVDLDTATDANWGIADGVVPGVSGVQWPDDYTPGVGEITYLAGDRSAIDHNHDAAYAALAHVHTGQALFTAAGALEVAAGSIRIYNCLGRTVTISKVFLSAATAPTGSAIIVDANKGGTTIFTNQAHRPQIAATANTGYTTTIDVASWADGEYLTMDIDAIGSTIAGADLTVHVIYS